jgi:hypothetical protein
LRFAYGVTTWGGFKGGSKFLHTTLDHLPRDSRVLVVDNKEGNWPLAKGWNYIVDKLLWDEAYDACIIMNDDVILRPDTGELLAHGLLDWQFGSQRGGTMLSYLTYWPNPRPELLLLSARHASWSDACTDVPDWDMLNRAEPIWQPGPDFSCFCVGRKLGQVIGRFDENFVPAHYEDNDTHRRIQLAGFEAGAFAPYWHFLNGTTRSDPERLQAVISSQSKEYYCRKWGVPIDGASPIGRETFLTPFNQ